MKYTNIYTDHPRPGDHSINGSLHNKQPHNAPNRRHEKLNLLIQVNFGVILMLFRELAQMSVPIVKDLPFFTL